MSRKYYKPGGAGLYVGATTKLPADLCTAKRTPHVTNRVRHVLGVDTKMPKSFSGTFRVDGHRVVVKKGGTGSKHRIFISVGGKLVPVGRVGQFCSGLRRRRRK